jgi:hypothetical protein
LISWLCQDKAGNKMRKEKAGSGIAGIGLWYKMSKQLVKIKA